MARILVVDDEDALREVIVEELTDEGHMVVSASGGQAGLDQLTKEPVDLILSDITMPQMNGYQFFRSVKEQFPEHAQTPFIFMTALSDRDSEFKGLRLGVDDYITKPVDFDLMLLRIEGHLRRRQQAVGASPQPKPVEDPGSADESSYRTDPESRSKLKAIFESNNGHAKASRFITISMEDVRVRIGKDWSKTRDQILQNAELIIRAHLDSDDIFSVTPSSDFIVCFADINEEELRQKTSQMRDEIWERLFSITNDEELASIEATAHELYFDLDQIDEEAIFAQADKALEQKSVEDIESRKSQLEKIYTYEEFHIHAILGASGAPSKIKSASFSYKIEQKIRELTNIAQVEPNFLLDLQNKMLERMKEYPKIKKAFTNYAMLLSVEFKIIADSTTRDNLISICQDLEKSLGLILILEIVGTPDRIRSYSDILRPLPVGRNLQFLELRRPQQAEGVDFEQIGVAYIAMSFENVMHSNKKAHAAFVKDLEDRGTKLYVKNIPEGKLLEAQSLNGKLFSMQG